MLRTLRAVFATAVFAVGVLAASTAFAASASWDHIDVIVHGEESGGVMMVSGELPADVRLPAQAELSVPAGAPLRWIGEILGGAASDDPSLAYTKTTAGSVDVYRFTLTKSRIAQVELETAAPAATSGEIAASVKWVSAAAVPRVTLGYGLPDGASIARPAAEATLNLETGLYSRTFEKVKAGTALDLSFAYTVAATAPAATTAAPADSASGVLIVVGLVSLLAIVMIVAVWSRTRTRTTQDGGGDPDGTVTDSEIEEPAAVAGPPQGARTKRTVAVASVIGVLLVFAVIVAVSSAGPQVSGSTISRTFATGEACANAEIALSVPSGADPVTTAEALFAALKVVPGINNATYDGAMSSVRIGYCGSESNEAGLRTVLQPTGLLTE